MIILRQKIFFLDANGNEISGADLLARKKSQGGSLADNLSKMKVEQATKANEATAARAAERAANKANAAGVKNAAIKARQQGYQAGQRAGMANATVNKGTLMNTWKNMGTAGKVGTVAAAAGATALMAKGVKSLFDKRKEDKQ